MSSNTAKIGVGSWLALGIAATALVGGMCNAIWSSRPAAPVRTPRLHQLGVTSEVPTNVIRLESLVSSKPSDVDASGCHLRGTYRLSDVDAGLLLCAQADVTVLLPSAHIIEMVDIQPLGGWSVCADSTLPSGSYCVSYGLDAKGFVTIDYEGKHYGPAQG